MTAYYSRASAGECSTSQYLSPECPGEAREKPGQAQKPQGASPQKSNFHHFSTPQVKIVRSIILSISMPVALTAASPGIITSRCCRKITKSQPRNERTHQIAKNTAEIFKKSRKVVRETSPSVTAYYLWRPVNRQPGFRSRDSFMASPASSKKCL